MIKEILQDGNFQKRLLWFNGAIPAVLLFFDWWSDRLGANPPEAFIRSTGVVAIIFLLLSLAVTPMTRFFKCSWLVKHRRWLGLWAFYYGLLHLLAYAVFDKNFLFEEIFIDIKKRPFILLGFLAFLIMLPLAITSTNAMIRRLSGKKWKLLHRFVYLAAIATSTHYWMIIKSDFFYPAIVSILLAGLFLLRIKISR